MQRDNGRDKKPAQRVTENDEHDEYEEKSAVEGARRLIERT